MAIKSDAADSMPPGEMLSMDELRRFLADLPDDAFIVGLYVNRVWGSQDEWLNALAIHLKRRNIITIGMLTPDSASRCDLSYADYVACLEPEHVAQLNRINVFVISDCDCRTNFPSASKVLGCVHSFYYLERGHTAFPESIHYMAFLDGWMVPMVLNEETRKAVEALWPGLLDPGVFARQPNPFHIIPVGYPRLAAMARKIKENVATPNALVYAPCIMRHARELGGDRVAQYGQSIIKYLLKLFPNYKIIFRPMADDLKTRPVRELARFFQSEPRFILDDHSDQVFAFSRAAAVITDLSNVIKSFAFSTFRPGIAFRPWENSSEPLARAPYGFTATTWPALGEAVRMAVDNGADESERIKNGSTKIIMPIDGALDNITSWIQDFYMGKQLPDWITIPRDPDIRQKEWEIIRHIQREIASHADAPGYNEYPRLCVTAANTAATYRRHPSPLLTAYALHLGKLYNPGAKIFMGVDTLAGIILGDKLEARTYDALPPDIIRRMYAMARKEYKQQQDSEGMALVDELVRVFDNLCPR